MRQESGDFLSLQSLFAQKNASEGNSEAERAKETRKE